MNFDNHPCFSAKAHHAYGRIHLPVAPRCNIQCKFCNRKFDCVNESRPGVTSGVLTPHQAMVYLECALEKKKNISVVGIAGPGDPFANADETMQTLEQVRRHYPEMMLCVATNGLNAAPYVDDLARLKVSHVTVTVNAVDPQIGRNVYAWVRSNKRVIGPDQGAALLLEQQLRTISALKKKGVIVKVNSIIIPGINEDHMVAIAQKMAELGVDILNCIPYYRNPDSAFGHLKEPDPELVERIRQEASVYIKQMRHCKRCRADAAGLLGDAPDPGLMARLRECEQLPEINPRPKNAHKRPNVAVASMEGVLVNQHLGQAPELFIYGPGGASGSLLETRQTPASGTGSERWNQLAAMLSDCRALLVGGVGQNPRQILTENGIEVLELDGLIEDALRAVFNDQSLNHLVRRERRPCGGGCSAGSC